MKYLVIIESTATGYSAYVPDLPGCIATGQTKKKVEDNIHEAIVMHLEGLREEGSVFPPPHTDAEYMDIALRA